MRSTGNVTPGTTYCFRLTNAGLTTNFAYDQEPSIVVLPIASRPEGSGTGDTEGSSGGTPRGGGGSSGGSGAAGGEEPPPPEPPQGGGDEGGGGGDTGYYRDRDNLYQSLTAAVYWIFDLILKLR